MGRLDKIRQAWPDSALTGLRGVPAGTPAPVVFDAVVQADPTHGKMVSWLLDAWAADSFLWEDICQGAASKTAETMSDFQKHKDKLPPQMRSLFKYDNPGDVWQAVSAYLEDDAPSNKEEKRIQKLRAYFESYQETFENGMKVIIPYTKFASRFWGAGTRWCTAAKRNNYFSRYMKQTPLCIFLLPSGNKYQASLDEYEFLTFLNAADNELDKDNHIELLPYRKDIAEFMWKVCRGGPTIWWRGYLNNGKRWEEEEFIREVTEYISPAPQVIYTPHSREVGSGGVVGDKDGLLNWGEEILALLEKHSAYPSRVDGTTYVYDSSSLLRLLLLPDASFLNNAMTILFQFKYEGTPEEFVDVVWQYYMANKLPLLLIESRLREAGFDCETLMSALYQRVISTFARQHDRLSLLRVWECPDISVIAKAYVDKQISSSFFQDAQLYKEGELKICPDSQESAFQVFFTLFKKEKMHWTKAFDYIDFFEHSKHMTVFEHSQEKTIKKSLSLLNVFSDIVPEKDRGEFFAFAMEKYQVSYGEVISLDAIRKEAPFLDLDTIVRDVLSGENQDKWKLSVFNILRDNCDFVLSDWCPKARGYEMILGSEQVLGPTYHMLRGISSSLGFETKRLQFASISTWIEDSSIIQRGNNALRQAILEQLIPEVKAVPETLLTLKQKKAKVRLLRHLRSTSELLTLSRNLV